MSSPQSFDIAVIGAGPSGSVAAALLNKKGFKGTTNSLFED